MREDLLKTLEPLEPLDLRKCDSLGKILEGMEKCSFGARNVGEVARTITNWIQDDGRKPVVIFEGESDSPLGKVLSHMYFEKKWLRGIFTLHESASWLNSNDHIIVVGEYLEREALLIYQLPHDQVIFINQYERATSGKVRDGYFPNVVFADPTFIVPLLYWTLKERLEGEQIPARRLIGDLNEHRYGGLGNDVVHGAYTWRAMKEAGCRMFVTISGAMTVAQMSLLICDMIEMGLANYISTTGALMAHGLVHSMGLKHYKYNPSVSDEILAAHKLNRVTDTLEPEQNFDHVEEIFNRVFTAWDEQKPLSVINLHQLVGRYLHVNYPSERGILKSAFEHGVPINVPALQDSEIGNDLYTHNKQRLKEGREKIRVDQELDTERLLLLLMTSEKNGIFTIGGGVPRNNTQNGLPLIELMNSRLRLNLPQNLFFYGCRIDPAAMHPGGMSGCTYGENMSWRKMNPRGRFAEIRADATIVWPFLLKFLMETL